MNEQACKILIIDESAVERVTVRDCLEQNESLHYELLEAEDVDEGVRICHQEKPDCVLLKYDLSRTSGSDIIGGINPDPHNPEFPVVLLIGSPSDPIAPGALENDVQEAYLIKSKLTSEEIHSSIQKAIETVRLRNEKTRAIEEFRRSEERLKLGVKVANFSVVQIDYLENTAHFTADGARLFGLGNEEIVVPRERVHAAFHPEDAGEITKRIAASLDPDGDGWFELEHRIVLENGEVRWLNVRKQIFFDRRSNPPRPTHGILAAQNITERKNAEVRISVSEKLLQGTIDALTAHIAILDKNGVIVSVNEAWRRFAVENDFPTSNFGIGQKYFDTYNPKNAEEYDLHADQAVEGLRQVTSGEADSFTLEYPCDTKDEKCWLIMRVTRFNENSDDLRVVVAHENITTRKVAEEKLRLSEERLSLAMKGAHIGTFDWNLKTDEIVWSREIEEATELSPDDFDNSFEGLINLIHPLDREILQNRIEEGIKTGEYECEFRMLKGDGTIRWVLGKGRVFYDETGEPARLLGVDIDITNRKIAEDELRENQLLTESIVETAPSMLYTIDLENGTHKYLTAQTAAALGYTFEELKNSSDNFLRTFMHPDDKPRAAAHCAEVKNAKNGDIFEFEYRLQHKSGEWRWFRSREKIFRRDEDGKPTELLGVALDITDRKLAEEKLRLSQIQTHLALEAANTIAFTWDIENDRVQRMHSDFEVLPETENDTLSGVAEKIYEEDRERFFANVQAALADPQKPYNSEFRICKPGEEIAWVTETGRFTLDESGKPIHLTGISADITERKRIEEMLRENSERLAATYNHAPIGIVETSLDGSYISVNDEFCHITGYAKDELLKLNIKDLTHPEDFARNLEQFKRLAAGEISSFQMEKRYVRKDGSIVWAEVNRTLIKTAEGKPSYIIGAIVDITERKQTAEQLRRNHETFFNLVQNAPFGIYVVDADFRLIQISKGSRKVFSTIDSPLGSDFAGILRKLWEEPFASEAIERFRHTLATGEPYRASDTTEQRSDIEEIESYDWKIERITLPDGRFGVVCYFYDLTERRQFEEKLRESEKRLRLVLQTARIGIFIYDLQSEKIEWSPEHYEIFGADSFDGTLEAYKKFVHPDDLNFVMSLFEYSLSNNAAFQPEFRIIRPDGEIRWVGNFGNAEYDPNGNPVRFLSTVFDITERKNAEFDRLEMLERERNLRREAEYANRSKDEFLAILSHELRTPLNSISGWVHMLLQNDLDAETTRRAVEVIARNVGMQNTLIEDLLDVSRIISGKMRLETEVISFISVIESALDAVRPFARQRQIEIELNLDPTADEIIGDKHRIQQIVGNLLTNAIKFSPENRTITLTLSREGKTAKFAVKDEGIGISRELLPSVFDRFRQADASSKRKYSGLGLGLTIVKHLVELHGGTISAFSEGENRGAEFVVELPLAFHLDTYLGQITENKFVNPQTEAGTPLSGAAILLVDDNQESLDLLCFVLEQKGAKVVCANCVSDALEELKRNNFDLLISDLGMPEMDGFDLIRELRKLEKAAGKALPAIAVTGYVSTEDRERVLRAGFQTHLSKPVDIENLCQVAGELIKKKDIF